MFCEVVTRGVFLFAGLRVEDREPPPESENNEVLKHNTKKIYTKKDKELPLFFSCESFFFLFLDSF